MFAQFIRMIQTQILCNKDTHDIRRFLLALLILIFSTGVLAISSEQWLIQKIQVKDGLPDNTVFSLQQDQSGYMWFGTTNGLARYDGYSFKVFKHDGTDPNTLTNNNAGNIFIDSKNTVWIGSFGGGVNTLNLNTGKLTRYPYSSSKIDEMISENVQTFYEDKKANIWVGTSTGLYQLNGDTLHHYNHKENENSLIHSRVWDVVCDEKGRIWIGTSEGLSQLDPQTGQFFNYTLPENMVVDVTSNQFRKLFIEDDVLWIGSSTGLYGFNLNSKEFAIHSAANTIKINDMLLSDEGHFLVASMDGLYQFDIQNNSFVREDEGEYWQVFKDMDVRSIFLDRSGLLWLATRDSGVIKVDQYGGLFQLHSDYIVENKDTENNEQIWSIETGLQGSLYLGTVERLYEKTDTENFRSVATEKFNAIPGIIRDTKISKNQDIWIASSEGLFFLKKGELAAKQINKPFDLVGIKPTDVFSIEETKSGELWLALYNIGVLRWNPNTSKAELIQSYSGGSLTDLNISHIYKDSEENMWIASNLVGAFRYNTKNDELVLFSNDYNDVNSLSSNRIKDVFQDSSGRVWIGTARGLNLYLAKTDSFKRYTQDDGLLDNSIYAIIEDSKQNIWIAYNFGLSRLKPELGEIKNFVLNVGIRGNGFNTRAVAIDKSDQIYLGSANGYYTFNPKDIKNNVAFQPQLKVTNVKINNQDLGFAKLTSELKEINLEHDDQVISFDVSALDYKSPDQIQYHYKISGLYEDWFDISSSRHIELTKLNPGQYELEIKASNNDGRWAEQSISIDLIVHPVWWKHGWVKFVFLITGILLALFIHLYRTINIRKQNLNLEFEVKMRTSELLSLNKKLESVALTDYLTGLYNRMGFISKLESKKDYLINSCFVIADIDNFKKINDIYGHSAGDEILKQVTKIMRSFIVDKNLVARWGGEEFIFYFENKGESETFELIEQIRKEINNAKIDYKDQIIPITCTFGICQRKTSMSFNACIHAADEAMYLGKSKGRNKTVIYTKD